jgi:hypothetical protein
MGALPGNPININTRKQACAVSEIMPPNLHKEDEAFNRRRANNLFCLGDRRI